MSTPLLPHAPASGGAHRAAWAAAVLLALAGGIGLAYAPPLGLLAVAAAGLVLAVPLVDGLAVLMFWTLPYLILNLPAGGVTLKVPEVAAYAFALAALLRAALRREPVALPPATLQVLVYLSVLAVSAAAAPVVPSVFATFFTGVQGATARSGAILFWLALSWAIVLALYHVVGTRPDLFRRCVRAHIMSGGISAFLGIAGYVAALRGSSLVLSTIGNGHAFVYTGGSFYRLTGVSYEPLVFAFYLVTTLPVTLIVAVHRPGWLGRRWAGASLALQILALLLTFSPGGWAALVVTLLVLALLLRPRRPTVKQATAAAAVVALLATVVAAGMISNPIFSRTLGSAVGKIAQGGYKMREDENATGMNVFHAYPVLGVGPGMVPFYFPTFHPAARSFAVQSGVYVNNLYIETLAETGVVGFVALAGCGGAGLAALGFALHKRRPKNAPVLTALTASLLGCAVQFWETHNLFLIYFPALVGLAVAGVRLANAGAEEV